MGKTHPEDYLTFMYLYFKKGFFFGLEREFCLLTPWSSLSKKGIPMNDKIKLTFLKTLNFLV